MVCVFLLWGILVKTYRLRLGHIRLLPDTPCTPDDGETSLSFYSYQEYKTLPTFFVFLVIKYCILLTYVKFIVTSMYFELTLSVREKVQQRPTTLPSQLINVVSDVQGVSDFINIRTRKFPFLRTGDRTEWRPVLQRTIETEEWTNGKTKEQTGRVSLIKWDEPKDSTGI